MSLQHEPDEDRVVRHFAKHMVAMTFAFKGIQPISAITTFVLSVHEQWLLVTASHCIEDVKKNIADGYPIAECCLVDCLGLDAKHPEPIPFPYFQSRVIQVSEDDWDFDYALIPLSPLFRQDLEKNNIEPLDEHIWRSQPSDFDFYRLVGFPKELLKTTPGQLAITIMVFGVDRIDERPPELPETDVPLFYGHVQIGQEIASIEGVSGGPVFGFKRDAQGQLRYWLIALLSRFHTRLHYITACPTRILGDSLEKAFDEYQALSSTP